MFLNGYLDLRNIDRVTTHRHVLWWRRYRLEFWGHRDKFLPYLAYREADDVVRNMGLCGRNRRWQRIPYVKG